MARKVKQDEPQPKVTLGDRPRLARLIIRNFRAIGPTPVQIDLDDIVVLVGRNNVGKSSVLKAYEVIMSEGSDEGKLSADDFPRGKVDENALPEIELHTVVYDNSPGPEWVETNPSGEAVVKERWRWPAPGAPERRGFLVAENRWATDEDKEKVPWGAAGIANARRPQPHRVDAFASPDKQVDEIVKLIKTAINDRVKAHRDDSKGNAESEFAKLLRSVAVLQTKIVAESEEQIAAVQAELSAQIRRIFPGHSIIFDAKPEEDLDKTINLFKANPQLLMGPDGGYLSEVGRQGSGARRALLWIAIRLLAESTKKKRIIRKDRTCSCWMSRRYVYIQELLEMPATFCTACHQ